ncbi:hypothetical protein B0H63DRAFT_453316 [Podospora didyma]|uniref:Uncharacterized protein n=1 Tax=Podospora didyma TaxID=330526 RepID=A0AAE0N6G6_9PEZI|nr:hypothetical protein B0H63DRAFT_453316 [Podospora didyma]
MQSATEARDSEGSRSSYGTTHGGYFPPLYVPCNEICPFCHDIFTQSRQTIAHKCRAGDQKDESKNIYKKQRCQELRRRATKSLARVCERKKLPLSRWESGKKKDRETAELDACSQGRKRIAPERLEDGSVGSSLTLHGNASASNFQRGRRLYAVRHMTTREWFQYLAMRGTDAERGEPHWGRLVQVGLRPVFFDLQRWRRPGQQEPGRPAPHRPSSSISPLQPTFPTSILHG